MWRFYGGFECDLYPAFSVHLYPYLHFGLVCQTGFLKLHFVEKNKKKIFFHFSPIWKFKYERIEMNENIIPLFESLNEENEMEYSFLPIPSESQFSFPPKLIGIGENEILFNEIFTKTPKILLIYIFKILNYP